MVFYYAITNYHILCSIIHKNKYNKDKKCILYLSKWHPEHKKIIENIKKTEIFEDVIIFEEVIFPYCEDVMDDIYKQKVIKNISNEIEKNNCVDFKLYDEINICGDHYGLSLYLNNMKIKYNYFEDASGILSNNELLLNNIRQFDYCRYQILKYLFLPGDSKYTLKRFGDLSSQLDGYKNEKDIDFSVRDELKKIDKKIYNKIVSIFLDEEVKIKKLDNYNILLTFHYNNLGIFSLEEQRQFYCYLIDYFNADNKLVIKPHPSDFQGNYSEWFKNIQIIPRKLPSELLIGYVKKKFHYGITGWSTSINGLKNISDDNILFPQEIDYKYKNLNKYYVISEIIKRYFKEYEVVFVNINEKFISNFFKLDKYHRKIINKNIEEIKNEKFNQLIIIESCNSNLNELIKLYEVIHDNDIIIYIDNYFCNIDSINICKKIIGIQKKLIDINSYYNEEALEYEWFYMLCKNKTKFKIIEKIQVYKELKYSNFVLNTIVDSKNNASLLCDAMIKRKCNLERENYKLKQVVNDLEKRLLEIEKKCIELNGSKDKLDELLSSNSWKLTKPYRYIGGLIKRILKK